MKKCVVSGIALATLLGLALTSSPADEQPKDASEEGWVDLFNGEDLTGWKMHPEANPESKWEVQDGLLVGSGPASHLFSERDDYTNFHYRVEAKINDGGNSGQYFRTEFGPGFPNGYEAQINATGRDPIKTGSLYPGGPLRDFREEIATVLNDAPHKPDEFFTQEVIVEGNHIIIKVNGKVTVDWKDPNGTYKSGHFALQQHDPGSTVAFKKIQVKELK